MGAIAAGHNPEPWVDFGSRIGEAFQVPDDLRDMLMGVETTGKPPGQDMSMGRPNAVVELGIDGAIKWLDDILAAPGRSYPPVRAKSDFRRSWLPRLTGSCHILPNTGTGDR